MPQPANFRAIRETVTMEALLSRYGVQLRRVSAHTLRGKCPLPSHTSKLANSFMVDPLKNLWSCHSDSCVTARNGSKGGNVLDFVTAMEKCSLREAALKITSWFAVPSTNPPPRPDEEKRVSKEMEQAEDNAPLRFVLRGIEHTHPYLEERGISAETAASFGVGFYGQAGIMRGRVVIPIHNGEGKLVAYAGRAIEGAEPKYRVPKGFKKSLELFNLHRAAETGSRSVIVVEGFFDCLTVHQAGLRNVVALMGSTLTEAQQKILQSRFAEVVLMLDGDRPGREATEKITAQLAGKIHVRVILLPDEKQPDQMTSAEIRTILAAEPPRPPLSGGQEAQQTAGNKIRSRDSR